MTPLIGQTETWLTWLLIALGIVGAAWLLARWIIDQAEDYPHDDDL